MFVSNFFFCYCCCCCCFVVVVFFLGGAGGGGRGMGSIMTKKTYLIIFQFCLNPSALQTKQDTCAICVDPDETAHNETLLAGLYV